VAGGGAHLLERADELARIDASLLAAHAGRGAVTLVEGPAGIGKTELLATASRRAQRLGMLVLSARGGELERSFPYAVVRQLFEPAVNDADTATRDRLLSGAAAHAERVVDPRAESTPSPVEASAVLHGLYWLAANLAAERPVGLVIDDVHWSDPASVSWLVYLARRIDGLAVALIVGARPAEPGASDVLLDQLRATDGLARVRPAPLTVGAVDGLAREILGDRVEPAFARACHAVTGGNPFYATELLRTLRQDRVSGAATDVVAIDGLTPRAVIDATLARLGRLPREARTVADAVALLEPTAELRWIAAVTGLDADVAADAADSLLTLGLLHSVAPCRFEHPILRSAVEAEIPPARRGRLHLRAARNLAAAEMPVDIVAAHLMQTPPLGEAWIASLLGEAARQASARGAPSGAAAYLQRALAERPPARERRALLLDLGKAESQFHSRQAPGHLREALALAENPDEIAAVALWLGQTLFHAGRLDEAFEILSEVIDHTDARGSDAMLELEAYLLSIATAAGNITPTADRAASLEARTPPGSLAAGAVDATLAFREVFSGAPREPLRERAERALVAIARGSAGRAHLADRQAPTSTLVWIDELDRAIDVYTELLTAAAKMGRVQVFEIFVALRGYALTRRGDLANAAADVESVLTAAHTESQGYAAFLALLPQVLLLVEAGRPDAAEERARSAKLLPGFERGFLTALLRHAEGRAQLAQGKFTAAAATLSAVGELCEANGARSPAVFPWRSDLALALAGTDRHDDAIDLAREELRLAERCDVNRARGVARRALGLLEGGSSGLEHLATAVRAFERSPARLERGWASYELGAALRRANRRRDARAPLDRALDVALGCGAGLLASRAREQLEALGARPRSVMRTGAESLTPSELRVCRLAGDGLKNTEIAQALFVSLKTVETHLRSAYRKLDIASRVQLPQAISRTRP
jgi:DNA-binding CsgD family transcriptional regulator/tetratricopeptide (TPR) repeat protein